MRYSRLPALAGLAVSLLVAAFVPAPAQDAVSFQSACRTQGGVNDPRNFTASCEIGPIGALRVTRVTYQKQGSRQPPAEATFLPFDLANRPAAILFLIDRSDRRRARSVGLAASDALRMADVARGGGMNRYGLATVLGDRLDVVAPIGSSRDDLSRAVASVRAEETPADETRGVLNAIKLLAQVQADRHLLVLAADGKPEDRALAAPEVVDAARNAGVVIITIGYRERSSDGPELASLKKLADETGGFYAEPLLPATRVEESVITRFGQFLVSGGIATFPLDRSDPRGRYTITVDIDGAKPIIGTFNAEITVPGMSAAPVKPTNATLATQPQVSAPGPKPAANTPPRVQPAVAQGPGVPDPVEPGSAQAFLNQSIEYVDGVWSARPVTLFGFLAAIVLIAGGVILYRVRRARRTRVYAWLELLDQRHTRLAVLGGSVRIGRHSDNDIRLRDKSVHRYHALLQRDQASGRFQITDVSRTQAQSNGVMVNGEFIHQPVPLGSGDTVNLGDVAFRFIYA